jgi:hypothetical protein
MFPTGWEALQHRLADFKVSFPPRDNPSFIVGDAVYLLEGLFR